MSFVHRLVRQHWIANDIADRKNMGLVGPHLGIDSNKSAVAHRYPGLLGSNRCTVGPSANSLKHEVIDLRLCRCALAFKLHMNTIGLGLGAYGLTFQHELIETVSVVLLPDLHQITVSALHQAIEHFHHINACAEGGIHGRHFQTNDSATNHQHTLGLKFQL